MDGDTPGSVIMNGSGCAFSIVRLLATSAVTGGPEPVLVTESDPELIESRFMSPKLSQLRETCETVSGWL